MNSDLNSDSKQCTESKLGRVHRVHTQRTQVAGTLSPHCAQAARTPRTLHPGRTHAARTTPKPRTSRALGTMSWPPSDRVASVSNRVAVSTRTVSERLGTPCLRFYFLNPSVQHFSYMLFTKHTIHTTQSHITQQSIKMHKDA